MIRDAGLYAVVGCACRWSRRPWPRSRKKAPKFPRTRRLADAIQTPTLDPRTALPPGERHDRLIRSRADVAMAYSGLQREVLALYRQCLRACRAKPKVSPSSFVLPSTLDRFYCTPTTTTTTIPMPPPPPFPLDPRAPRKKKEKQKRQPAASEWEELTPTGIPTSLQGLCARRLRGKPRHQQARVRADRVPGPPGEEAARGLL